MGFSFTPPAGLLGLALTLAALMAAVVPTCLYLYVEPRGRMAWATAGDTRATRRAPGFVRLTAWLSFAVGQLSIPWLLVPAACAGLLYAQLNLGLGRPVGVAAAGALGLGAIVQSILAFRLIPLGIRLLARDTKACAHVAGRARWNAVASAVLLGAALLFGWAVGVMPSLVHPVVRGALLWTAVRPVAAYAAVCLAHALLLGRCARVLPCPTGTSGGPS